MNRNIILIGNPVAGSGALRKIEKAAGIIKGKGLDFSLLLTEKKGDAEIFARAIRQNSESKIQNSRILIIAAGGDGTYNEVANGLVHSNIPMAILPLGTTCVLARELNIPEDLEKALDIALNGEVQTIHLGRITCAYHSSLVTRHFLLMAGIGFDGETVYGVNEKIKRISGKGAYILSGIKTLLKYNPQPITLRGICFSRASRSAGKYAKEQPAVLTNGAPVNLTGYAAIISKASCYGGSFKAAPDAKLTDPYFYVFATHKKRRLDLIKYISGIMTGRHLKYADISYCSASEIEIGGDAHIQIDGDYAGTAPARVEVIKDALQLVCSR